MSGLKNRIALESGYKDREAIDYNEVKANLDKARNISYKYIDYLIDTVRESVLDDNIFKRLSKENNSIWNNNGTRLSSRESHKSAIPNLVEQRVLCCGCSACMNICKQSAIKMQEDEEGFMYPIIDNGLCIRCELCMKICQYKKDILL